MKSVAFLIGLGNSRLLVPNLIRSFCGKKKLHLFSIETSIGTSARMFRFLNSRCAFTMPYVILVVICLPVFGFSVRGDSYFLRLVIFF